MEVAMASTGFGVLVGYDGSWSSHQALSWAAHEARARGVLLTVCHSWTPGSAGPPLAGEPEDLARESAERILATGARSVLAPDVNLLLAEGPAADVLCEHSDTADVVVVGSRGLSGLSGLMLGSVSLQVAAYASGPVVVVRGHWRPAGRYQPGPIVVGVDGSEAAGNALAFAGAEAVARDVPLVVVCALPDTPGRLAVAHDIADDAEQSILRWEKDNPGAEVHRQITIESPGSSLLTAAQDAQLLVVGCRGRGLKSMRGMPLGSVTHTLLWQAPCPLAVVHTH
jgi:nucleotide-binding universal stress UspA family protein